MYKENWTEANHPILEFGTATPSGTIPMGRTVKESTNTLDGEIVLVNLVGCEHGDGRDQMTPAPATRQ
jgi:hypothetical protein